MSTLCFLLNFLTFSAAINTGSHSLCSVATFMTGDTPFAEFTVLMMLDDFVWFYYDSDQKNTVTRAEKQLNNEEQEFANMIFRELHNDMKNRANLLKGHFNYTNDINVEQRVECCELLSNNVPGQMKMAAAFNGLSGLEMNYNDHQHSLHTVTTWPLVLDSVKSEYHRRLYLDFLHPACTAVLVNGLKDMRNNIFRKVKPRVRLLQKPLGDSQGARVTCLATGFYPRHLNLTLLRNGQLVPETRVTGGQLLPNGDGTYQMRKSLEVSVEELRHRHNYTCTANHLSLDNKLDIHLDYNPVPPISPVALGVMMVLLACVMAPIAAFIIWKKSRVVSPSSSQTDYSAASAADEKDSPT